MPPFESVIFFILWSDLLVLFGIVFGILFYRLCQKETEE